MSYMSELKQEIDADPLSRGYSGMTAQQIADDLNTKYRSRNKTGISGKDISEAIDSAEYAALGAAEKDRIINFTQQQSVDPFGFAQIVFLDMFAGGSTTIQNLASIRVESISRATELGWREVKAGHVIDAQAI